MIEILSNIWFWVYVLAISSSIMSIFILFHQNDLFNLKKSMGNLQQSLIDEDEKINQNFAKIHKDLDTIEREMNQMVVLAKKIDKSHYVVDENLKSGDNHIVIGPSYVRTKSLKPIGKKAKKFLTLNGEIKKKYRDNPIAQKCYQKFQALKQD